MTTETKTETETEWPRKVYIKVEFVKIEDIDTIKQVFSGTIFVKAKWREPALEYSVAREGNNVDFSTLWNPKLCIHNVMGEAKQEVWHDVESMPDGSVWVVERRRAKGIFTETMELMEFPFDTQDISVLLTSELSSDEVELDEDPVDISTVITHSFVDGSEWHLRKYVYVEPRILEDANAMKKEQKKPGMFFRCCVVRRWEFFLWNNMLVMSLISALSFTTFAVDVDLTQNRIQLSFILVLAGVTFKFAASQAVPKISYLTHLDRYVLASMIFLFCVCVWHSVVSTIDSESTQDDADLAMFIVFVIIYVVLHSFFFIFTYIQGRNRRREITSREQSYLKRLNEQQNPGATNEKVKGGKKKGQRVQSAN